MKNTTNKKVLMLCYYFPPYMEVGSLRSRKYAQYFPRYGWGCEIVTAYRGKNVASMFPESVHIHPAWTFDFDKILSAAVKLLSRIRYKIKGSTCGLIKKNGEKRDTVMPEGGLGIASLIQRWLLLPDSQFVWILLALPKALWVSRSCDVIYSSSSPVSAHVLGLIIHKLTGKPWVSDYRDAWTLDTEWFPPTRFHRWIGEQLEKACVKNARYIVNVTEQITQNFKKKYLEYVDKWLTIHNGYDEDEMAGFRGRKSPENYMLFTSLGSMYSGRNPIPFLEVLDELLEEGFISRGAVKVSFIGAQDAHLEIFIAQHFLHDIVKIFPQIPQLDAFEHLSDSHVALLIGSDMERTAMTSKVFEYAGMGKLIFALVPDGPVKDFVEKCSGMVADPKDKAQIKSALRTLIRMFREGHLSNSTIPSAVLQYERSALASKMARLLCASCSQ
jgi:glycosyltransferase involved in cell wall biosynthesis